MEPGVAMVAPHEFQQTLAEPTPGSVVFVADSSAIQGRSLGRIASRRLRRGKVSMAGDITIVFLILVAVILVAITRLYVVQNPDTLIARAMDVFLAYPLLLFAIALVGVLTNQAFGPAGNSLPIALLIFLIGFFGRAYMGRIIRGQFLALREREFVDAARSLGVRAPYILFRELPQNLVAPILVYLTLLIRQNILLKAYAEYPARGLPGFPGRGANPANAGFGRHAVRRSNQQILLDRPHVDDHPKPVIFIAVMAFNLFGGGLRDALDPKTQLLADPGKALPAHHGKAPSLMKVTD
jgi:ABC-type dipeptide/oligopeptide/nickel transport system permease subunit